MVCNLLKIFIVTFFLGIFSMPAFAQYTSKDSFDYLKDDGIFSDEEKDEESFLVKQQCDRSVLERQYYNCSCLAGAFRLKRDEEKVTPQGTIMYKLLNDEKSECVDPSKIAGKTYADCMESSKILRPRRENNEKFCKCLANSFSEEFSSKPRLKRRYIKNMKVRIMGTCHAKTNK